MSDVIYNPFNDGRQPYQGNAISATGENRFGVVRPQIKQTSPSGNYIRDNGLFLHKLFYITGESGTLE